MQTCTAVGPVVIGAGHDVAVQALPTDAPLARHAATGTLVVLFEPQVVVVQLLPEVAGAALQDATGTLLVVIGAGQVVVVQLLPETGPEGEQELTGTFVVVAVPQVVAV